MTDEFGTTAWGRDWRRLAEPTSITRPIPALPRARSLARNDRVHHLEITAGRVQATVDDRAQHRVTIVLPIWDGHQTARVHDRLTEAPTTGDLPDNIHTALRQSGADPGPDPGTLTSLCDCTSRTRPCVHLLALYFELAHRLDEQPRLALTLRGHPADQQSDTTRIPLARIDPTSFYGNTPASDR